MNRIIRKLSKFIMFLVAILMISAPICAQEEESGPVEPYLEFSYWKNTHDEIELRAKMTYFTDLTQPPLPGLTIKFYTNEDDPYYIGSAISDEKGLARYIVPDTANVPLNMDGMMYFYAEFEGSEEVDPALEEVWAQDVMLDMILEQHEGERNIHLKAMTIVEGDTIPVADEDIYAFIPRMFSDLLVGEGYFDEEGNTMIEFPEDIPGDSLGNITIIARFDDHYMFGNVEKREEARWGVPSYHEGPGDVRTLWTQIAPKWMVITLSVLLAGVWGHYIFAIVSIVRISKNGNSTEKVA